MNTLKTNKFKVGDEVTFINYADGNRWEEDFGLFIGDVVQITSIHVDDRAIVVSKTGKHVWCYTDQLSSGSAESSKETQTYNPLKENKFRVGDYVKIINHKNTVDRFGGNTIGFPQIGLVGIVNNVTDHCVGIVGHMYLMDASDVELSETSYQRKEETQTYNPLVAQEGGGHYRNRGIQPIEYSEANNLGACQHSVVKYITRHQDKNGIEDLSKIVHFTFLEAYFKYGEQGSTELKEKVLKLLGEHG